MKKLIVLVTAITFSFGSSYYSDYYQNEYMEDMETGYEKYRVVSSTPITKEITKRVRVGDDIRDKVISKRVPCNNNQAIDRNSIGLDTIIGTVAGVAIGNQFKNHKDAAKVIGGLGGGFLANQMRGSYDNGDCYEKRTIQEYIPRYENITETITVGYKNCIKVDGKRICKESKRKRKFLKVKKTYSIY